MVTRVCCASIKVVMDASMLVCPLIKLLVLASMVSRRDSKASRRDSKAVKRFFNSSTALRRANICGEGVAGRKSRGELLRVGSDGNDACSVTFTDAVVIRRLKHPCQTLTPGSLHRGHRQLEVISAGGVEVSVVSPSPARGGGGGPWY